MNHATKQRLAMHAAQMRAAPTTAESQLWAALSGSKLGVGFRRQWPVGDKYIADFCAPSARLIVEVDGAYHGRRQTADARRDRCLARLGYQVVRVTNKAVADNLAEVVATIVAALLR